jgi:glucose/arabinose dehydrogenase
VLGAHVAALGLTFYTGDMFPESYRGQIFIAQHGSWNRSEKVGYDILLVRLDPKGRVEGSEVFASGWLQGQDNWGRPNDVLQMPDGALLVSDDQAGVIYRISHSGSPQ